MLRNNALSNRSYRASSTRRLQRLIQLALILTVLFSFVYIQTHTKVKFSVPDSRQELWKRLSHPSIRRRFHRREPGDRGLLGGAIKKLNEKKITDEWDWDEEDGPYEKKFAAVIEEKKN